MPPPSKAGVSDKYHQYELSLPFARIEINQFMVLLKMAQADCGDGESVTLAALRSRLETAAWRTLEDEESSLSKFLLSAAFKDEGAGSDEISIQALTIFALLHCPGKVPDKAEHLYNLLQDGGLGAHQYISANDKDIIPAFDKLCGLACFELIACQDKVESIYSEEELENLKEQVELLREDQYLEDVYGTASRLTNDEWLKKMSKEAKWLFDPVEVRKRLFEAAEVEVRHC